LAFDFIFERVLQVAEGIQIFDFRFWCRTFGSAPRTLTLASQPQRA